jgi:hypothetical protein
MRRICRLPPHLTKLACPSEANYADQMAFHKESNLRACHERSKLVTRDVGHLCGRGPHRGPVTVPAAARLMSKFECESGIAAALVTRRPATHVHPPMSRVYRTVTTAFPPGHGAWSPKNPGPAGHGVPQPLQFCRSGLAPAPAAPTSPHPHRIAVAACSSPLTCERRGSPRGSHR